MLRWAKKESRAESRKKIAQFETFGGGRNPTAHETGNPMYSSRSGANVCSATAVDTCGCQRQDWALGGERQTNVNATLAGIHDRGIVSWHVHDFGLHVFCSAGASRVSGADERCQSGCAAVPGRSGDGLDRDPTDLFAAGKAVGSAHESCDHADVLSAGKVEKWDALFYVLAQFAGGVAGTLVAFVALREALAHRAVNFAITRPGMRGIAAAFAAEVFITFLLMTVILNVSNSRRFARFTGFAAGAMVMLFITFEVPFSGMSMNPARSFASDLVGMQWQSIWIYFSAPLVGMLSAAEVFVRSRGLHSVICAKLNHSGNGSCIFRCGYMTLAAIGLATD
jgi:hypothetical protein